MPKEPTRKDLERAEREVGDNIPDAMVGEDDGDVRRAEDEATRTG